MADTPIFSPPQTKVTDKDPMIVKVPMESMDWANRKSQQPTLMTAATVANIPNRT